MKGKTVVVAGNGPSLATPAEGRILSDDVIVRVNNFFFEPERYLGARVDLAYIGGDPRIVPFICAAIRKASDLYDVRSWSAPNDRVRKVVGKWIAAPFVSGEVRNPRLGAEIEALQNLYQAAPTAGIRAVLLAHAQGASQIVLTGLDLYTGERRYTYEPGPHQRALLGPDLGQRGYDERQHQLDLDRKILELLARSGDAGLYLAGPSATLSDLLPLAPIRDGMPVTPLPKRQINDWPHWAGLYPIHLLRLMRTVRQCQMALKERLVPRNRKSQSQPND